MTQQKKKASGAGNAPKPIGAESADLGALLGDDLEEIVDKEETDNSIVPTPSDNDKKLGESGNSGNDKSGKPKKNSKNNCFEQLKDDYDLTQFRELYNTQSTTVNIPKVILEYMNEMIEYQNLNTKEFSALLWYKFIVDNKKDLDKIEKENITKKMSKRKGLI